MTAYQVALQYCDMVQYRVLGTTSVAQILCESLVFFMLSQMLIQIFCKAHQNQIGH